MSSGKFGKMLQTAIDRAPGLGSVQRLIDKARGSPTKSELDIQSIINKKDDPPEDILVAPVEEDEQSIEKLCNVSRLHNTHRSQLHRQLPNYAELPWATSENGYDTYHFQRRLYARYGASTQILPGKLWPTPEELADLQVRMSMQYVMTAQGILEEAKKAKEAQETRIAEIRARDEEVAANIPKIEERKEQLYKEAIATDKLLDEAEEKRNKRIEQVRKFFSYTLSVRDPRFKDKMTEMIQSEKDKQKKAAQVVKKEKKEARKKAIFDAA